MIVANGPSALDGGDDALPMSDRAREVVRRRALPRFRRTCGPSPEARCRS